MRRVPESDWKKLRAMKDELLNLACERIFEELEAVIEGRGNKSHEAYLRLWEILKKEDAKIATMFDDVKRSNAVQKLAAWNFYGLISDEELAQFSEETQEIIHILNQN